MKRLSVLAAVVLVVLMVHAWMGSAVGVSPLVSCVPDCTGVSEGGKVPDPMNCTAFYYCSGGTPYGPVPCESGIFDPDESNCAPGDTCESACSGATCPLTCNGTLDEIGDAFNCSVYYYCTPAGPSPPQPCPNDRPYYDGNSFGCVNDKSVCCNGYCDAYCDGSGFSLVADPQDCTWFYICDTEEGTPGDDHHFQCGAGKYFSVQIGDCVEGTPPDPCKLCEAAGGGNGDSTTTSTSTTTTSGGGDITTPGGGGSTDINGCVSSLVCTAEGNFPACSTCQPEYFQCSGAGAMGVLDSCTDDTVFNPTPGYPYCVLPSNCPYP